MVELKWNFVTLRFEVGASNEKYYLCWSANIGYGNQTRTDEG